MGEEESGTTVDLIDKALISKEYAEKFVWSDPEARTNEEKDSLYGIVNAVSEAMSKLPGYVNFINDENTEFFDGPTDEVYLRNFPINSITSVHEGGEELDAPTEQAASDGDYDYYKDMGIVYKTNGHFTSGRQKVKVIYNSGFGTDESEIPDDIKMACVAWVKQINDSEVENFGTIITAQTMIRPTDMPEITRKLLAPYRKKKV